MAIDITQIVKFFEPIQPKPGSARESVLPDVVFLVIYLFLTIGGVVLTVAILYGGIMYITSAGDETKAAKGRASIVNGVIGAIIVILSFAFIRIIQNLLS